MGLKVRVLGTKSLSGQIEYVFWQYSSKDLVSETKRPNLSQTNFRKIAACSFKLNTVFLVPGQSIGTNLALIETD